MNNVLVPKDNGESFFRDAQRDGYSMKKKFLGPNLGGLISSELEREGYLEDYTELIPTYMLDQNEMTVANLVHRSLNRAICRIDGRDRNHLPLFSIRVFDPGLHGTTIHRNDPCVGPWAIGITLKGKAPFNVYDHSQLPEDEIIELQGGGQDPVPLKTMNASAGSAWTLYTADELVPHSSGVVKSSVQRELIIFYATDN